MREIPHLYAVLDVGHAFVNRWDMPEVLVQLGDRLLALHLHDNHGQLDEHLPIGQGAIDFGLLWSVLETSPWQPALVLEYHRASAPEVLSHARYLSGLAAERVTPAGV